MALTTGNTYIEPVAGASITISRGNWNQSLRAVLTNFSSTSPPSSTNFTAAGANFSPPDGLLFHSKTTNSLFIVDSVNQKGNPVHGGNYTRLGIGHRLEKDLANTNVSSYELGEIFLTLASTAGTGNTRLYVKSANAGTIVDVGIPSVNTVTNSAIAGETITATELQANSVTGPKMNAWITIPRAFTGTLEANTQTYTNSDEQDNFANAAIKMNSDSANVAISFNSTGSSQAVLKHVGGGTGSQAGLIVGDLTGKNTAPLLANALFVADITGADPSTKANYGSVMPVGTILQYGGSSAPTGFLLCNGATFDVTVYNALHGVLSGNYKTGGESAGQDRLPNFTNRFPLGAGAAALGNTSSNVDHTGAVTSSSGGPTTHGVTTTSVAASAKDSTTTDVVTAVDDHSAHTHTVTIPHVSVNFIIKT